MSTPNTLAAAEVRAALARADISQSTLARETSRSNAYWSRRLSGELALDVDDLSAVADLCGITIRDLLRGAA